MKHSVCRNLFEKIDTKRNVQTYHNRDVYRCEMTLQKLSIKLWLEGMFRIDVQNENQMKTMYRLKQFRINVQKNENNVWIKTIWYMCVLVINNSLRIHMWLVRLQNWRVIGSEA